MKNICSAFLLLTSLSAFAQTNSDNISGDQGAPGSAPLFKLLISRVHTFGIEQKVIQMQNQGLRVATFTASGAMLYDHEIDDQGIFPDDSVAGRNAGFQLLPYTISLTEDNRVYISTSLVGFKNMNAEMQDNDFGLCEFDDCRGESAWKVIDNLEIAKFEYNKNFNGNNIKDFHFKTAQIDTKLNILPSLPANQYLALKTGTSPLNYHKTQVTLLTNDKVTLEGFESNIKYGLEYNINMKKGWRINAEVVAGNQWSWDHSGEIAPADKAQYDQLIASIPNNGDAPYIRGQLKNRFEQPIRRTYFYVAPKIEISKKISKEKKCPVRVGINVNGKFAITDNIQGAQNIDLKLNNTPTIINTGVFLNF